MGINVDVSEVVQLCSRIETGAGRVGAQASAVLRKTALDIEADGKMLVEAYDAVDTGDMMNSISTSFEGDGRNGTMAAEIGPTVEYAVYVHDGTSVLPGRPFMADAFDRRIPGYTEALAQVAERSIL